MNYLQFVNNVLDTAKSHKLVYEVGEGDIYEHLNSGDHKYPCVFLTVQNIDYNGSQMTVTGSLFYVDSLLSDTSNKLQIQATGMTTLQQIFMRLMDNYPDFELRTGRYTPFDEKFSDLCAGVFSNFTVSFMDDICIVNDDIFEGDEPITPEPEGKYMTITVDDKAGETIIAPHVIGNLQNLNLQYRINNGKWTDFIFGTTGDIHVFAGDSVQWKGNNPDGVSNYFDYYLNFSVSDLCHLSGNVMSLIDSIGETTVIPDDYSGFYRLFENSKIKTVSSDFLPATTLKTECYREMFSGCTELTNTPELPATDLTEHCYLGMFQNCTSLTTSPELHSTVMALGCYNSMFKGCTSLTTAPELPATQLYIGCYSGMFEGCTSLTTAPELPGTTIYGGCYDYMFRGCTSLNYVKCLAVEFDYHELLDWLLNVAPTGTFVKKYGVEYLLNSPSGIPEGWTVEEIDVPIPPEPTGKYMTITVDSNVGEAVIEPQIHGSITPPNLQYRINSNGDWNDYVFGQTGEIHLNACDFVQFKGNNPEGIENFNENCFNFYISDLCHLSGNVMSLIDGVGDTLVIPNEICFQGLFENSHIKTVSKDFLPATSLKGICYSRMFKGCKSLLNSPELPATSLKGWCYESMFSGCVSLEKAPELNANIIDQYCYESMFWGCENLTQVQDVLPATELNYGCYENMFRGCKNLTKAPSLPATSLRNNCYQCMFQECKNLTKAPELNATTLVDYCYFWMLRGCSKLNYVKCLATDITATGALEDWLYGVAPTGTFVKKYGVEYLINSTSGIPEGWTVEEIDAPITEPKYMTITVDSNAGETIIEPKVSGKIGNISRNLQYRLNGGDWNEYIIGETNAIRVFAGDVVQLKGNNPEGLSVNDDNYLNIHIYDEKAHLNGKRPLYGNVHLSGNVMSLIDGVGETTVIPCDGCFNRLFDYSDILTVSKDFLPATELKPYCYQYMFNGCEKMTNSPELPAMVMKHRCYGNMFYQCHSLVNAPELPSITIDEGCYLQMFRDCVSLEKAPELPATTLYDFCYDAMFFNCKNLKHAPVLNATVMKIYCYDGMFYGCKSLTTAPELPAIKLAQDCYSRMFQGCTSLTTVPEILPATNLQPECYRGMFENCTSLVNAPELPATTLTSFCYTSIFSGCYNLNYVKCLATEGILKEDGTSTNALTNWLHGVSTKGTFVKPAGVSYPSGSSGIPEGWTVEEI